MLQKQDNNQELIQKLKKLKNIKDQDYQNKTTSLKHSDSSTFKSIASLLSSILKITGIKVVTITWLALLIFVITSVVATGSYYLIAYSTELERKNQEKKQVATIEEYQEGKITFNNKNEIVINETKFYIPVAIPENKNQFYALMTIRFAEAFRPDYIYTPNDFLSCGTYQQMTNELIGNNPKALIAKVILKEEYQSIILDNSVDILRWSVKGYTNVQDGEITFQPIYRSGKFLGWARTVPGMIPICKRLVENHLKTGLFDRIALARLQAQGRMNYINSYDLNVNNVDDFVTKMCQSQGPVDCGSSWNVRAKNALISALNSNLYEAIKK